MDYYRNLYCSLFDDVFVYYHEDLFLDFRAVVRDMCDFIGVDSDNIENKVVNRSLSWQQIKLLRVFNTFFIVKILTSLMESLFSVK